MNERSLFNKLSQYRAIVMCGLPGSGKSYLARRISKKVGAKLISTDKIRMSKVFTGISKRGAALEMGIDDEEYIVVYRKRVYEELVREAKNELLRGKKVVLDGLFLDEKRDLVLKEIKKITEKMTIVVVRSSKKTIFKRCKQGKRKDLERVYSIWVSRLRKGSAWYPTSSDGVDIIEVENN